VLHTPEDGSLFAETRVRVENTSFAYQQSCAFVGLVWLCDKLHGTQNMNRSTPFVG
jgi:hypothetical protein